MKILLLLQIMLCMGHGVVVTAANSEQTDGPDSEAQRRLEVAVEVAKAALRNNKADNLFQAHMATKIDFLVKELALNETEAATLRQISDGVTAEYPADFFVKSYADAYATVFSIAELGEIREFYRSKEGQGYLKGDAAMDQDFAKTNAGQRLAEGLPLVKQALQRNLAREGASFAGRLKDELRLKAPAILEKLEAAENEGEGG